MLAKNWKRILLIVLIIACLTNVLIKIVCKNSLQDELQSAVDYVFNHPEEEQKNVISNSNDTQPAVTTNNETVIGPDSNINEVDQNSITVSPFSTVNQ